MEKLHNTSNRKFAIALLLTVILSVVPILIGTSNNLIPNSRGYWHNLFGADTVQLVSSEGIVTSNSSGLTIGNFKYAESSTATLQLDFWEAAYFSARAREVTKDAVVHVYLQRPVSTFRQFTVDKEGWGIDSFGPNWQDNLTQYATSGEKPAISASNGTLDVSSTFSLGVRTYYLLQEHVPNVNTTQFPFFFAKWRSTDHIARLDLYTAEGNEYKAIVESADGSIYAGTYGGGYSPILTETVLRLPQNQTLTRIVLGVDSGGGGGGTFPVSGTQHAYFSSLAVASAKGASSFTRIGFDGVTVLNEDLIYPLPGSSGSYTFNTAKYPTPNPTIEFPINASSIKPMNHLTISVGQNTELTILSAKMSMNTYAEELSKPYLADAPPILVASGAVGGLIFMGVLAYRLLRRISRSSVQVYRVEN
jgi:hypothetical protein